MKFIAAIWICGGIIPANECQLYEKNTVIYQNMEQCWVSARALRTKVEGWIEEEVFSVETIVKQISCKPVPINKGIFTNLEIRS